MSFFPWSLADSREDVDGAGLERDDGALGVLALAGAERVRRVLPVRLSVFTEATLTLKIFSIASLISVLFERGSTTKVYLPSSIRP